MHNGGLPAGEPVFCVDVARCVGCFTCAVACKDRAGLADGDDWLRVERRETGAFPHTQLSFRVIHCFHCARPVCAAACPVGAISRSQDGWVQVDGALCTGCGACTAACPFGAVSLGEDGRATKCDGCDDQVAAGQEPTCVRACPMRALWYGVPEDAGRPRVADADWDDAGIGPRAWHGVRASSSVTGIPPSEEAIQHD